MAIGTLYGTTWYLNEALPLEVKTLYLTLRYTKDGGYYNKTQIRCTRNSSTGVYSYFYGIGSSQVNVYKTSSAHPQGEWVDEAYRTIYITGGTATEDPATIQWFLDNATQIIPYPEIPVKVSGSWASSTPSAKIGGEWKTITDGYVKVNGTWQSI